MFDILAAVPAKAAAPALWDLLGKNAAQIQALAAAATVFASLFMIGLTIAILLVYSRQAKIMGRQADLAKQQADISDAQLKLQQVMSTLEWAAFVVPNWAMGSSLGWKWCHPDAEFRNAGRGAALDIKVCGWRIDLKGGEPRHCERPLKSNLLGPGEKSSLGSVVPRWPDLSPDASLPVLVIHYKDAPGKTWHTTVNLDPETGEWAENNTAIIWNPDKWKRNEKVQEYCLFCRS